MNSFRTDIKLYKLKAWQKTFTTPSPCQASFLSRSYSIKKINRFRNITSSFVRLKISRFNSL